MRSRLAGAPSAPESSACERLKDLRHNEHHRVRYGRIQIASAQRNCRSRRPVSSGNLNKQNGYSGSVLEKVMLSSVTVAGPMGTCTGLAIFKNWILSVHTFLRKS